MDTGEPQTGDYLTWLKRIVNVVDVAMEAEGVEVAVRDRVVRRLRTGTPDREQVEADLAVIQGIADAAPELPANRSFPVPPFNA